MTDATTYTMRIKDVVAHARLTDAGFVVLRGSLASGGEARSISGRYKEKRTALLESGLLSPTGAPAGLLMLTEDYSFSNSSEAACVLTGAQQNGIAVWADTAGNPPPRVNAPKSFATRRRAIANKLRELAESIADLDDPAAREWHGILSNLATQAQQGAVSPRPKRTPSRPRARSQPTT